nr:MAG TPA: hypothetical protein [Bacteriophage sp.]
MNFKPAAHFFLLSLATFATFFVAQCSIKLYNRLCQEDEHR